MSGEFIDALHGDHWVKSNIETNVQRLLSTTDKLTFDSNGIALLDTTVANVLETAFNNGIVDIDETGVGNYSVTALGRQDLNQMTLQHETIKDYHLNTNVLEQFTLLMLLEQLKSKGN